MYKSKKNQSWKKVVFSDLEKSVFEGCKSLESIILNGGANNIIYGSYSTSYTNFKSYFYIADSAFKNCEALKFIELPAFVSIHDDAFKGCSSLQRIIYNGSKWLWNDRVGEKNIFEDSIQVEYEKSLSSGWKFSPEDGYFDLDDYKNLIKKTSRILIKMNFLIIHILMKMGT